MARLAGFFLLVLALMWVLRHVPGLGWLGHSLIGFWLIAILLSFGATWASGRLLRRRRMRSRIAELGHVDTPHNQGKLGSLLLAGGRARAAVPPLEKAVAGEDDVVEWRYRLGIALLESGRPAEAAEQLAEVARREPEHAYGAVQLRLAEARLAAGDPEASLATVEEFERGHGEKPESAYRAALAQQALGRRAEARASLRRVRALAAKAPAFQRREARGWALKSLVAGLR